MPDQLLLYWQTEGWNAYANGLFWTVNPDDYEDTVDEWLADTPFEQIDAYHVIARTAFGELFLCGEKRGCGLKIVCSLHAIFARDVKALPPSRRDLDIRQFFAYTDQAGCDLVDVHGQPLFAKALQSLGPVAPDEMYGFEPALVVGGQMTLDRLRKVKIAPHLSILRQLAAPTMPYGNVNIDKLIKDNT